MNALCKARAEFIQAIGGPSALDGVPVLRENCGHCSYCTTEASN